MRARLALFVFVAAAGAAGCSDPEINRPGTWKPSGINDQNLRAMLVDPQDYTGGVSALTSRGDAGSRAVTRLLTDRRRALLDASVSRVAAPGGAASDTGAVSTPGSGSTSPGGSP